MSNWVLLLGNGLWILGGALALGTLSYALWLSRMRKERLGRVLGATAFALILDLSGVLLSCGLLITASNLFEKVLWGLIGAGFLVQVGMLLRRKPTQD